MCTQLRHTKKVIMTFHVQAAARNWLNCRYVPVEGGGQSAATNTENERDPDKSEESDGQQQQKLRPQMVNYFRAPNFLWFLLIPGGLAFTFIVYYNVNWIPTQHLSFFGDFVHTLGTRYNFVVQIICIGSSYCPHLGSCLCFPSLRQSGLLPLVFIEMAHPNIHFGLPITSHVVGISEKTCKATRMIE
ncbi:hypothetical protein M3Y97_00317100 [Aphelenchoides bicaudatus]|nr:hypothetical protein M3Y97_00317100 [Aphelenchoides bicaudatus]